jgi:hypothetical protein
LADTCHICAPKDFRNWKKREYSQKFEFIQ